MSRPRQALLDEYNVMWVPLGVGEFAVQVLPRLDPGPAEGHVLIGRIADFGTRRHLDIVAELASHPPVGTEFLLGAEPTWADIAGGRVADRDFDDVLFDDANSRLAGAGPRGILVITGTGGSGKSSAAMKLALRLSGAGHRIAWSDRDSTLTPGDLRREMSSDHAPDAVVIDDADVYGSELAPLSGDIATHPRFPLVIAAVLATRIAQVLSPTRLPDVPITEHGMPVLSDADIDRLIDLLERENRLGVLRGTGRARQRVAFRSRAERQLLVAMIEATSGQKFEDKITIEFAELPPEAQIIYSVVTVASNFGFSLSRQDILSGLGDRSNTAVGALDQMIRSGLILPASHGVDLVRSRHRVIANVLIHDLQHRGVLADALAVTIVIAAGHVSPQMRRTEKPWRLLRDLLNHDFLMRTIGVTAARALYADVEGLLSWDHHYWLHRGSMELEAGRLDLAQNFLGQAHVMAPEDPNVQNEWAYLLYKRALADPAAPDATGLVEEARSILRGLIADRGRRDYYSFHVYGSQGLAWVNRASQSRDQKMDFLDDLIEMLRSGTSLHPDATKLTSLLDELQRARLLLAT